ncbi:TPA: hypothetical protein ACQUHF_005628 [Bacillus paranthracis]|uniref:hypothetical protein n=1 Tax=Bacillus cereus group TaxID=86661 RepID=UPI0022E61F3F|nr:MULTISPECIES: hypothetical protein [Bacillus cereus group]MDA2141830.1 hypothetical protein [Bacillus cereus group sp. Bc256]MDH2890442.1 hypothetical protein [Bacillus cytotoxicus]
MKDKVLSFLATRKKNLALLMAVAIMALPTISMAAGETDPAATVTTQMTTIRDMALTVLGSVAAVAIVLFGGIYVWKYGKKIFSIISK